MVVGLLVVGLSLEKFSDPIEDAELPGRGNVADVGVAGEDGAADGSLELVRELLLHGVEFIDEAVAGDFDSERPFRAEGQGSEHHLAVGGADVDVRLAVDFEAIEDFAGGRRRQGPVETVAVVAEARLELREDRHGHGPVTSRFL